MNLYTERVIFWIETHAYSKEHWETVAQEALAMYGGNVEQATIGLGESISQFHEKFRDAVVKPDNVLHDFVGMGFEQVDWKAVAEFVFANLSFNQSDAAE